MGTGGSRTAPTGEGAGAWGNLFLDSASRCARERPREREGGMGPRIREDNGGDGRFANRPYGLLTTRASAAWGQSIFIAITGEGAHEGRPYGGWGRFVSGRADVGRKGEGWVPACARTTEGEGMMGEGWVPACRGHGGRLCVGIMGGRDGSPHPRGHDGGGRAVREPPLRVVNNEGFSSMGAIYFHSNHGRGRPRGTPLRGLGSVGGEGTGEGWVPACARTTSTRVKTGDGPRNGRDGSPHAARTRRGRGWGAWRKRPQRLVSWRGPALLLPNGQ